MFRPAQVKETLKYLSVGCCAVAMLVSSAYGQAGKLTIECLPTSGSKSVAGFETVTVECYISLDSGSQELFGANLDFYCDLPGKAGSSGSIGGGVPDVNVVHGPPFPNTDHLFGPLYTGAFSPGLRILNLASCLAATTSPPSNPPLVATLTPALSPAYIAEITYQVSNDVAGQFTFDLEDREEPDVNGICGVDCFARDADDTMNPCSAGNPCGLSNAGVQETCCIDPTNATRILLRKFTPLPFNYAPNNFDVMGCGTCQLYGDVFPFDPANPNQDLSGNNVGNCLVDIDDLLVELGAFAVSPNHCHSAGGAFPDAVNLVFPCGQACQDGVADIDDVLAMLGAFGGTYACAHPCNPGACCLDDGSCLDWDQQPPGETPPGGMSATACVAAIGTFQGNGTTCADVTCP